MSGLAKTGEIVIAEVAANIVGAVAYIPPHRKKASYFDQGWPVLRSLVVAPMSRGIGVRRMLTQDCIKRAERDGSPVPALHTSAIMTVALRCISGWALNGITMHRQSTECCMASISRNCSVAPPCPSIARLRRDRDGWCDTKQFATSRRNTQRCVTSQRAT